jgi:glycosyltransferase involved in cell wall biosynthesis
VTGKANIIKHILYRHKFFKKSDTDIILSFLAPFNMVNIVASAFTGKKIIVGDRSDPKRVPTNVFIRKIRNFLYRFADGIVLQSEESKCYFSKKVQKKSRVIFNPVNVGEYRGAGLQTDKEDKIVSVARIIEQKNPQMLLEAFFEVHKCYPSYSLVFFGEGEMKHQLQQRAKALELEAAVKFPGAVKDVFEKIKSARLFVMSSNYEGMPNALIEAMCIGIPVVSTRVCGAVDLIKDGENGRLVDCADKEELAAVIMEMLSDDRQLTRYAENASKLNDELEVHKIANQWISYIQEVLL